MQKNNLTSQEIVNTLKKPFLLEAKKGYANDSVTRGLDTFVTYWLSELETKTVPLNIQKLIYQLKENFKEYANLGKSFRKEIIGRSYILLERLEKLVIQSTKIETTIRSTPDPAAKVQYIKGVGPNLARLFLKLGIRTVKDLLYYFPRDYEDRRNLMLIKDLVPGKVAIIKGIIQKSQRTKTPRGMQIIKVLISDKSGNLKAVWFNQPYLYKYFDERKKEPILILGKVEYNTFSGESEVFVKNFEILEGPETEVAGIIPLYPLCEGVSQKKMRAIIQATLSGWLPQIKDVLPEPIRDSLSLMTLSRAINALHFPKEEKILESAHFRLAFEEFFFLQLGLALRRSKTLEAGKGIAFAVDYKILEKFEKSLSFKLTCAQHRVLDEILQDLESTYPMNRLLQGDVGSGKTIVAVAAMLVAVSNGYQVALMVPTEILAFQHYGKIRELLKDFKIEIGMLSGGLSLKTQKGIKSKIESGNLQIIVGTQALIQEKIYFNNLGLCIIDEQHRFGVVQRTQLKSKSRLFPDLLVMTATPIPRTLSLTLYGDLDCSVIDEMPPGRTLAITCFKTEDERGRVYQFMEQILMSKRQAYVVCPLLEESEKIDLAAAKEVENRLRTKVFPKHKTALIHGKMKSAEKEKIMVRFKKGQIDILVATSVIEVGIDVPNANLMLIEQVERFGLSQLHQLRGRIGRGSEQSYCFLMGSLDSGESRTRIEVFLKARDGFEIAEADLNLRGPGEFFGIRQSGLPPFKVADIIKDESILKLARQVALEVVKNDIELSKPENASLKHELVEKYGSLLNLCQLD